MKNIVLIVCLAIFGAAFSGCSFNYDTAKAKYVYLKDKYGKVYKVLKDVNGKLVEVDAKLVEYDETKKNK